MHHLKLRKVQFDDSWVRETIYMTEQRQNTKKKKKDYAWITFILLFLFLFLFFFCLSRCNYIERIPSGQSANHARGSNSFRHVDVVKTSCWSLKHLRRDDISCCMRSLVSLKQKEMAREQFVSRCVAQWGCRWCKFLRQRIQTRGPAGVNKEERAALN